MNFTLVILEELKKLGYNVGIIATPKLTRLVACVLKRILLEPLPLAVLHCASEILK